MTGPNRTTVVPGALRWLTTPCCLLLALLLARPGLAQDPDLAREIQEIAARVAGQLEEIDRLLLEAARRNQARSAPKQALQQTIERGRAVEQGIDELIDKLQQMKNQGGGGQPQDSQDQQQQDQQNQQGQQDRQQRGRQNRRENQTPDIVPQGQNQQQQPGQQQPEPRPADGRPEGQDAGVGPGENRPARSPTESETGPGSPGQGSESWGELQGYQNFLKHRGSAPKVPEKYRKYWEAYLKQKQVPETGGK